MAAAPQRNDVLITLKPCAFVEFLSVDMLRYIAVRREGGREFAKPSDTNAQLLGPLVRLVLNPRWNYRNKLQIWHDLKRLIYILCRETLSIV